MQLKSTLTIVAIAVLAFGMIFATPATQIDKTFAVPVVGLIITLMFLVTHQVIYLVAVQIRYLVNYLVNKILAFQLVI